MSKKVTLICMVTLTLTLAGVIIVGLAIAHPVSKIKEKFGQECKITDHCDDMIFVDCNSPADGPAYYLDKDLNVIGESGGLCMGGHCSGAPKEWLSCKERDK
jgi:hypothetical protein